MSPLARRLVVAAVCILVAVALVVLAVGKQRAGTPVADVAETPGTVQRIDCGPLQERPADDNRHVEGRTITYPAPPASGDHSGRWAYLSRPFYVMADRPDVSVLVHNLEHGYNVLWYDQDVVRDPEAVEHVRSIANTYAGSTRDPSNAFIAAPWTDDDGGPMPPGRHYALTHWYADPDDRSGSRADEVGYTRYCTHITAGVVRRWMHEYPLASAPEGFRASM